MWMGRDRRAPASSGGWASRAARSGRRARSVDLRPRSGTSACGSCRSAASRRPTTPSATTGALSSSCGRSSPRSTATWRASASACPRSVGLGAHLAGVVTRRDGRVRRGGRRRRESMEIATAGNHASSRLHALFGYGHLSVIQGRPDRAIPALEQGLVLARLESIPFLRSLHRGTAQRRVSAGRTHRRRGDHAGAGHRAGRFDAACRQPGAPAHVARPGAAPRRPARRGPGARPAGVSHRQRAWRTGPARLRPAAPRRHRGRGRSRTSGRRRRRSAKPATWPGDRFGCARSPPTAFWAWAGCTFEPATPAWRAST